ncbi:MAG: F0F1 ATP synthase subunit epsilon [Candidatus Hydrogenedens sp.]
MSVTTFTFQIYTLNMKPITLEATSVSLPVIYKETITVLPGHTPLITALDIGIVSIQREDTNKLFFAVMGGIAQITQNRVVIYTNAYEEGKNIPEDEMTFNQWTKSISYEKKKEEDQIRFYLINTIKKWQKTHRTGNLSN